MEFVVVDNDGDGSSVRESYYLHLLQVFRILNYENHWMVRDFSGLVSTMDCHYPNDELLGKNHKLKELPVEVRIGLVVSSSGTDHSRAFDVDPFFL